MNDATVTVTAHGHSLTFPLSGDELSRTDQEDGTTHAYLSNASRGYIADEVEKALLILAGEKLPSRR
jgi:hypothetical protein